MVGNSGRYELSRTLGPRPADFVLAGEPLPLAGTMRVYTCGITPYDVTHLGHAATFAWADLLLTLARAVDLKTVSCRNVTDVDDVLTEAAERHSRHYDEFAVTQEFLFDRDMRDLSIARPDIAPRAHTHVNQVIQLTEALLRLGQAYEVGGTVFFTAPASLSHGGLEEAQALAALREFGDEIEGRRTPWDVALWRPSGEDHPTWPSPWGWGRPAWHVECAAMAATVFGSGVDGLVGGADLAFPHHAYQAAMVEALSGAAPFARRQVHVGTVCVDGAKMAKSTGNLVLVRDLLAQHSAAAVRLLLLDRRWSEPWTYEVSMLDEAADRLERLRVSAGRRGSEAGRDEVIAALLADLDVPRALDVAEESGGPAARAALDLLKL